MTHPPQLDDLAGLDVVPGEVAFRSWLLAFGVVPVDRHRMAFDAIGDRAFDEASDSWLQRSWRHRRRVLDRDDGGCTVTDHLEVVPRIGPARPLVAAVVGALFRHRHRRLVRRFGAA